MTGCFIRLVSPTLRVHSVMLKTCNACTCVCLYNVHDMYNYHVLN